MRPPERVEADSAIRGLNRYQYAVMDPERSHCNPPGLSGEERPLKITACPRP